MRIVSNSSALIFLNKINQLHLLDKCYSAVMVAEDVVDELQGIALPPYITRKNLTAEGNGYVQGSLGRLHRGELTTMRLAQELNIEMVLLDDLIARHKAQRMGLQVMGTLGVLLLANHKRLLSREQAIELITQLTERHNLYLSKAILHKVYQAIE